MDKEIISINLRRLRKARGFTQAQIADLAGISRIAYRKIETGDSIPRVSTLQNIVSALGVRLEDLFTPVSTLKAVRFRSSRRMNSRDHILTEVSRWLDDFNYLENLLNDKQPYLFKELAHRLHCIPSGRTRAEFAAEESRKVLGLTEKEPIRDIAGLLEKSGIKLFPITLASDGFFGLSVAENEGGPAIVVNVWERISVERWIFSAAHELGHLLLHLDAYDVNECNESVEEETEANLFASYFLMPQKAFISEWNDTYGLPFIDRVLKVKRIFQVSYKTVLYRLASTTDLDNTVWQKFQLAYKKRTGKTLAMSEEPEALMPNSFQQSMPEVLRANEPDSLSSSDFIEDRLSRLVRIAIEQEQISMSRGAEILRLDMEAMRDRIASWE
jgi:Zn-dependent peptidase ImmA (M78 family)/DNA-binding XRE family transcriptional regulator